MSAGVINSVARFPQYVTHNLGTDVPCLRWISFPKSVKSKLCLFVVMLLSCVLLFMMTCFPMCPGVCGSMCDMLRLRPLVGNLYNTNGSSPQFAHKQKYLPGCIVIGVRKAGTRAILRYLNIHPNIVTENREMHFFDVNDEYNKGLEYYRKQMPSIFSDQITIEKTPSYFTEPFVPERVYRMNSSILLLLVVRDPITRVISDYVQFKEKKMRNGEAVEPFEKEAFDKNGNVKTSYGPIQTSSYFLHFARWLEFFPLSQIYVVDGELLITDPYKEMYNVETFLNLDHRISRDKFFFNDTKGFYCINDVIFDEKCMGENKGRQHPTVKPKYLQKLKEFFRFKNQMFFKMINKTFDWM